MGSVSEPSAVLSLLLLLLSLMLPLLLLLLLLLLMLLLLLILLILLLLLLSEAVVVLFSARDGWKGTRRAERAIETRKNILRSQLSADSSLLCQMSHLKCRLTR